MAKKSLMLADDLAERSSSGRLRSRLLRDCAIEFANKFKLEIDLLYVKNLHPGLLNKKQVQALEDSFEDVASAAMSQFKKNSVKGRIHLVAGSPAEEILRFASVNSSPDVMMLGTHGKKGLTKLLLGSVAEEVLRLAKTPVMVLGPAAQEKQNSLQLNANSKILLMTDLSPGSAAAEDFACKVAQQIGGKITLLHCVGDQIMKTRNTLYGSGYVPFDMDQMFEDLKADAKKDLTRKSNALKKKNLDITAVLNTTEEPIEKSLLKVLRDDYSAVIMGTHGRSKFLTAFLGSTARKSILCSPIPVFVVRSKK